VDSSAKLGSAGMRLLLVIGPIRVFDLILFETTDHVELDELDRQRDDEGPDELDRKLRGED
jgi:hypothetical protein